MSDGGDGIGPGEPAAARRGGWENAFPTRAFAFALATLVAAATAGCSRGEPESPLDLPSRITVGDATSKPQELKDGPPAASYHASSLVPRVTLGEHVLVLSADGAEPALGAIAAALEAAKIPYALWVAREHPGALTGEALSKGRNGLWRGVVLATGNLGWFDGTRWTSALSEAEWRNLWGYEAAFGVRQVTWFTYPTGDYGFLVAAPHDPADGALVARPTRAGATLFPELAGQPLRIEGAWAYLAQPLATRVTPLLVDHEGRALAAIARYEDGRENLAFTFDSTARDAHARALGPGVVRWLLRQPPPALSGASPAIVDSKR